MEDGSHNYHRFLHGDNDGMVELIRGYRDGLILYINGIVRNISVAEELAEDVFVKLVVDRPRFNGKSSFKTWLYAMGHNIACDHLRRRKRAREDLFADVALTADEEDLWRAYCKKEEKLAVHHALSKINTDYAQVLYLVYFEELGNREAASVMHKTTRQIENLLYRAKIALRTELEKEGFVYEKI